MSPPSFLDGLNALTPPAEDDDGDGGHGRQSGASHDRDHNPAGSSHLQSSMTGSQAHEIGPDPSATTSFAELDLWANALFDQVDEFGSLRDHPGPSSNHNRSAPVTGLGVGVLHSDPPNLESFSSLLGISNLDSFPPPTSAQHSHPHTPMFDFPQFNHLPGSSNTDNASGQTTHQQNHPRSNSLPVPCFLPFSGPVPTSSPPIPQDSPGPSQPQVRAPLVRRSTFQQPSVTMTLPPSIPFHPSYVPWTPSTPGSATTGDSNPISPMIGSFLQKHAEDVRGRSRASSLSNGDGGSTNPSGSESNVTSSPAVGTTKDVKGKGKAVKARKSTRDLKGKGKEKEKEKEGEGSEMSGRTSRRSSLSPYPQSREGSEDHHMNDAEGEGSDQAGRTPVEEDKRRRNTAASARFRAKKKERDQALERQAFRLVSQCNEISAPASYHVTDLVGDRSTNGLRDRVDELEKEAESLRKENTWLRDLILETGGGGSRRGSTSRRREKEDDKSKSDTES